MGLFVSMDDAEMTWYVDTEQLIVRAPLSPCIICYFLKIHLLCVSGPCACVLLPHHLHADVGGGQKTLDILELKLKR